MTTALEHTAAVASDPREIPHVLEGVVLDGPATLLATMLDRAFLQEAGWDPRTRMLSPPARHRLLGRQVCRAEGCDSTAHHLSARCVTGVSPG